MELTEGRVEHPGRAPVGTVHLAKGLACKAVQVAACDDELLPLQERVDTAAVEFELEETERQLFYVARTRARDRLVFRRVASGWEFLADVA